MKSTLQTFSTKTGMNVAGLLFFDADDREVRLSKLNGGVVVMVGGGRKAAYELREWGRNLSKWPAQHSGLSVPQTAWAQRLRHSQCCCGPMQQTACTNDDIMLWGQFGEGEIFRYRDSPTGQGEPIVSQSGANTPGVHADESNLTEDRK